jgi:SAM-dependent methyltransferase
VFSIEMAKRHPDALVLGLDTDGDLVSRANAMVARAGIDNCRFEVGDVTSDVGGRYDLVLSVDNLEHVEDDIGALRQLRSVLEPGGRLVVHVPGYYRRWLLFGRRVNFDVPGHVRPGYRSDELLAKLEGAGFDVVSHQYTYGPLETFTNNISYLITGADQRRRLVYAAVFPLLLAVSYFGKFSRPGWGAGIVAVAQHRASDSSTATA